MGSYGAKNGPSKVTKHFSLLLDGKLACTLCCSGYVIFWLRDRIAKFKPCQILKYSVLAKIDKINARQILLLYGNILVHLSSLPLLLYIAFDHTWQKTKWDTHTHTTAQTHPQSTLLWVELANVHADEYCPPPNTHT